MKTAVDYARDGLPNEHGAKPGVFKMSSRARVALDTGKITSEQLIAHVRATETLKYGAITEKGVMRKPYWLKSILLAEAAMVLAALKEE